MKQQTLNGTCMHANPSFEYMLLYCTDCWDTFARYYPIYIYTVCCTSCGLSVLQYFSRSLQGGEKKRFNLFGNRKKKDDRKEGKKGK